MSKEIKNIFPLVDKKYVTTFVQTGLKPPVFAAKTFLAARYVLSETMTQEVICLLKNGKYKTVSTAKDAHKLYYPTKYNNPHKTWNGDIVMAKSYYN